MPKNKSWAISSKNIFKIHAITHLQLHRIQRETSPVTIVISTSQHSIPIYGWHSWPIMGSQVMTSTSSSQPTIHSPQQTCEALKKVSTTNKWITKKRDIQTLLCECEIVRFPPVCGVFFIGTNNMKTYTRRWQLFTRCGWTWIVHVLYVRFVSFDYRRLICIWIVNWTTDGWELDLRSTSNRFCGCRYWRVCSILSIESEPSLWFHLIKFLMLFRGNAKGLQRILILKPIIYLMSPWLKWNSSHSTL